MRFIYTEANQSHTVELTQSEHGYRARVDGHEYDVRLIQNLEGRISFAIGNNVHRAFVAPDGSRRWVFTGGDTRILESAPSLQTKPGREGAVTGGAADHLLRAPMPGQVRGIQVKTGDHVEKGQTLLLLEAMKMEIRIQATRGGKVARLPVKQGQTVERDQVLAEIE